MANKFTKADRNFLRAVGISADDTSLDDERFDLAQRISKHTAPGMPVKVSADAARLALVRLALERLLAASEGCE